MESIMDCFMSCLFKILSVDILLWGGGGDGCAWLRKMWLAPKKHTPSYRSQSLAHSVLPCDMFSSLFIFSPVESSTIPERGRREILDRCRTQPSCPSACWCPASASRSGCPPASAASPCPREGSSRTRRWNWSHWLKIILFLVLFWACRIKGFWKDVFGGFQICTIS